ncbi:MAG: DUF1553 domain-containing protein, partial [Planctomycetaceae bacterium]
ERLKAATALNDGLEQIRVDVREKLLLQAMGEEAAGDENLLTDDRVARLKELLLEPKTKDIARPLSLFATLLQKAGEQSDADAITEWLKLRSQSVKAAHEADQSSYWNVAESSVRNRTVTFADFTHGFTEDWLPYGAAFQDYHGVRMVLGRCACGTGDVGFRETIFVGDGPTNGTQFGFGGGGFGGGGQFGFGGIGGGFGGGSPTKNQLGPRTILLLNGDMKWTADGCVPDNGGSLTSASLSPKLRGELHSPEFELTHPEIHILASGKNARVRLVIDGYVMNEFSELLFAGCRQPIDTDGEFRWIKIAGDVKRYLGHRCHLEFLDDGDGWFAVREVKFVAKADEVPATRPEIASTNRNMNVGHEHSRKQLAREWAQTVLADPTWPDLVLRLRLLPTDQQAAFDKASAAWMKLAEQPQPGDPVLVMCDGTGEDEYVFIRGNHNNHGPTAKRHMLTALDGGAELHDTHGSGRMELADRVLAESNPFPARIAVNRVWQHLFGRGIVASSDNFGVLGEAPTHPELLDLLADDFRKDGWSLKRLIKRLVLTRAYRLSSQRNASAEQLDPTNRLLHRFSIRRLEGEVIRDTMLSVSGQLDKTMYGASVPVYLSSFMEGRGRPGSSGPLDGAGRRSIYQSVNRNFLNPFMLAFDTPQPATAISRRSVSNVPAQSLILMNNEFVHQQASVWAKHLLNASVQNDTDIIKLAYRSAFAREPSESELASLLEFARGDANSPPDLANALQNENILTSVCHVLLNQKELLFLE